MARQKAPTGGGGRKYLFGIPGWVGHSSHSSQSSGSVREHEGRVPQPGVPKGPRTTQPFAPVSKPSKAANYANPEVIAGPPAPPSSASSAIAASQRQQVKQERAEARQQKLVNRFVFQRHAKSEEGGKKGALEGPSSNLFTRIGEHQEASQKSMAHERDRLLNHPKVQQANAEGKVVGPKGLTKIVRTAAEESAIVGPKGLAHSKEHGVHPRSLNLTGKQLTHIQDIQGVPQGTQGRRVAAIEGKAHEKSEPSLGGIVSGLSKLSKTYDFNNPGAVAVRNAAEGELSNLGKVLKHREGEIQRNEYIPIRAPSKEEIQALNLIPAAEGISVGARAGLKASEIASELATREGAARLASKAAESASAAADTARGAARVPRQLAEALKATPEALRGAPAAASRGLKQLPEALRIGAKASPGASGRFLAKAVPEGAHSFSLAAGAGAAHKSGFDLPGSPLGRLGAFAEGTEQALRHNPGGTLATTARSIPGLIAAPVSLTEAAVESATHGTPKPLENTAGQIASGTAEMAGKLLSGNPSTVQGSVEHEVGLTPLIPVPAVLKRLHGSDLYEAPRGAIRKAVEKRREGKREKRAAAETGERFHDTKKPPESVPVSSRPGEHYVIPGFGKYLEGKQARRAVSLDTTRASSRAEAERKMVAGAAAQGFRTKAGTVSRLANKMGPEYEAAAFPLAKYGIPHSEHGHSLARALAEYFPEPRTPVPGSLTDRMAVNAALEHPGLFTEKAHAQGTEALRGLQQELAKNRGRNDVAPLRVQNDFTNHLSAKAGLPPVLKDYERITPRARQFTSPQEAAAALKERSLRNKSGKGAAIIEGASPYDSLRQWKGLKNSEYVWVFHGTTPEVAAEAVRKGLREGGTPHEGARARANKAPSTGTYVTLNPRLAEKYAQESGGAVLALRVRKSDIQPLPEERGLPGGRTTGLVKWEQGIVKNVSAKNVVPFAGNARERADALIHGNMVSREGAWAHYEVLDDRYNQLRKEAAKAEGAAATLKADLQQREIRERNRQLKAGGTRINKAGKRSDLPTSNGAVRPAEKTRGPRKGEPRLEPSKTLERKRAEFATAEANARGLRREADAILQQKKGLYGELKDYTHPAASRDHSKQSVSSRGMKEEFRREQRARNKHFGLREPVYIADTKPQLPGEPGVKVERPIPVRGTHFKEGVLSRSGEANARFEPALMASAVQPRIKMAMNELVHNTVNERKQPVSVKGDYKHVLTDAEEEWAKRHGTWPANAVALDSGLVKQGLIGAHSLDGQTVSHIIAAAEHGGAEAPGALRALGEKYPDIKDELIAASELKGRKVIAVEKAALQELKDQFAAGELSKAAHIGHAIANAPTRIILNSPAWVGAQLAATSVPIAAALGPGAAVLAPAAFKAMAKIEKMSIADRARIASMLGSSPALRGTPAGAFEAAHDPFSNVRAIRKSGPGSLAVKLANGEVMGAIDRWNAAKMREFAAAVRASKGFRNWYGGFKGMNEGMRKIADATKGMSAADRIDYISRHPELAREMQRDVNRMAGNWNSFTALERRIAPFTIFYPWIRYSVAWTLKTFPLNHPVAATVLAFLAQRNGNELQALAAKGAKEAGVAGITPNTPLADIMQYANPVHQNAKGEAVENPKGLRFSPGVGVAAETALTGNPVKSLSGLNPFLSTGISLATDTNTFTGQKLEGSLPANFLEQMASMSPLVRLGESAAGFRGFGKQPQSATSKAYEMLAGGKSQKNKRSFLDPYLTRPASRGALENALNIVEQRISKTGSEVQGKVEGNLWQSSAKNKREATKLKEENKKAWEEKDRVLKAIDPSGALSRQSEGEYKHFLNSLPPLGGSSSSTSGGIFGGSSSSSLGSGGGIFGESLSSSSSSGGIFGGGASGEGEYKPPKEGVHIPHISIPGIGGVTGAISSLIGGTPAFAATRPLTQKQHAQVVRTAQSAAGGNKPALQKLYKRTLGKPSVRELVQAGKAGTLKINGEGKITTPRARKVQGELLAAQKALDAKTVPNIAPLSSGGGSTEFAKWFAHYSHLNPQIAAAWVLAEGAGEGGTTGGEAGRNNWLAAGYPAHKTPFSEAPYFNGSPKRAAKATAEWMEGKIGSEYGYPVSSGIANAFRQFKGKSPEEQARLIASSGWVDGNEGTLNPSYFSSIMSNAGQVAVQGHSGKVPAALKQRVQRAQAQAKKLGISLTSAQGSAFVPGKGRYVFPFANGWQESRTDMGKDYAYTRPGAPIRALGSGTIVEPVPGEKHWEGGNGIVLKLDHAKGLPSPYVFTYEGIEPGVKAGQHVKKGQVIGRGGITGSIETGFSNAEGVPLAAGEYSEDGIETRYGKAMANLLHGLAKGKTKIPSSLLNVGGGAFATSNGALTPAAVNAYATVTGGSAESVASALKGKQLTPKGVMEKLKQNETALERLGILRQLRAGNLSHFGLPNKLVRFPGVASGLGRTEAITAGVRNLGVMPVPTAEEAAEAEKAGLPPGFSFAPASMSQERARLLKVRKA